MVMALVATAVVAMGVGTAAAGGTSEGCASLNEPFRDDSYNSGIILEGTQFFAGERIRFKAALPFTVSEPATVTLRVPLDTDVASTPFPGTLTYTVATDTVTSLAWRVDQGNVMWTVSCDFDPNFANSCPSGLVPTLVGTAGNDILVGTEGNDVILGRGGNDRISGLGGNDTLCGGGGNDQISGGSGNDNVWGDAGNDDLSADQGTDGLYGGSGDDRLAALEGVGGDLLDGGTHVTGDACGGDAEDELVRCNP